MPQDSTLRPADPADLVHALSYALRWNSRGKPHRLGSELTAYLAAEVLVEHLARAGFVIMQKPPVRDGAKLANSAPLPGGIKEG